MISAVVQNSELLVTTNIDACQLFSAFPASKKSWNSERTNKPAKKPQITVFCDWFSAYQIYPEGGLPVVNNGCVLSVDNDGEIEWTTQRKIEHVESYDTKVRILCDGFRVLLDGNISRLGRPDNVFGLTVWQCLEKANELLRSFGLPAFSQIDDNAFFQGKDSVMRTGCQITRLDLTCNYFSGNQERAGRVVNFLSGQAIHGAHGSRAVPKPYGIAGISWNEGSKFWYAKLYNKFLEMGKHATDHLSDWVKEVGLLRHEISLKSRYLKKYELQDLRKWLPGANMENIIYGKFNDVLTRNTVQQNHFEDMPENLRGVAMRWRDGENLWLCTKSRWTKNRWRKELLPYGIDIKLPCDVTRLSTRLEVISLSPLAVPDWYWAMQETQVQQAA